MAWGTGKNLQGEGVSLRQSIGWETLGQEVPICGSPITGPSGTWSVRVQMGVVHGQSRHEGTGDY